MHFSLVQVGAHDGSKTERLVAKAIATGKVLLIEPVPFLFERLLMRYRDNQNVIVQDICVTSRNGSIDFVAPMESANSVVSFGDQLGSVLAQHAVNHNRQLSDHLNVISVASKTFSTLVSELGITSIDLLMTDTEGLDVEILPTFPFDQLMPSRIVFEFKHSDGTCRVGSKLANFLIQLERLGFEIIALDAENMLAINRKIRSHVLNT